MLSCKPFLLLNILVLLFDPGRLRDYWPGWTDWSNRSEGKSSRLWFLCLFNNIIWVDSDFICTCWGAWTWKCRSLHVLSVICLILLRVCVRVCVCHYSSSSFLCCACHFFHLCLMEAAQRSLNVLWMDVRRDGRGRSCNQTQNCQRLSC